VAQRHHRLHDGPVVGLLVEVLDEAAVDLERLDGQPLQVAQRRVPGAEVVDGQMHAQLPEGAQDGDAAAGSRMSAPR